jgi:hypothetical protein
MLHTHGGFEHPQKPKGHALSTVHPPVPRVAFTPLGKFQLNTCPPMPLRWLRRLRGGGKIAGSPAHPPPRSMAQQLSSREIAILENPSAKAGEPRGASRGASAVPANHCHTLRLAESHRLTVWSDTSRTALPRPARAAESHLSCHYGGKKHDRGCRPAQSRESEPREWFSDRVHASPPRSATQAPPSSAEKELSTPLPDSFF